MKILRKADYEKAIAAILENTKKDYSETLKQHAERYKKLHAKH